MAIRTSALRRAGGASAMKRKAPKGAYNKTHKHGVLKPKFRSPKVSGRRRVGGVPRKRPY